MVRLVCNLVLWAHRCNFLATIELLLAGVGVHDDAQGSDHVNSLAFGSVPQILLAVGSTVAVDVFDLKFSLGGLLGGLFYTERQSDYAHE